MFSLIKNHKSKQSIDSFDPCEPKSFGDWFSCFDIFYLCYDEPNRKKNWKQIKSLLPGVKKVEGVKGFDRALKTCAKKARTPHFFLIDGDNSIIESKLDEKVVLPKLENSWVLSWASLNPLNGLTYGNGGLKLWPKDVALEIQSHENSGESGDQTDYCFIAQYFLIDQYVTQTQVTTTAHQAFRAGFREGVKMSLAWGKQVEISGNNFETLLGKQNRLRLKVWCEVGTDVPNGYWAILGARMGLKYNLIHRFDSRKINSYLWLDELMNEEIITPLGLTPSDLSTSEEQLTPLIEEVGEEVNNHIPIGLKLLTKEQSIEFKKEFKNPPRSGLLK